MQGKDNYRIDKLADDIASLVTALGHESCTLVAHDWGGVISWLTAHAHPSLIDKLVVICAPHPKCEYDLDQYKRYCSSDTRLLQNAQSSLSDCIQFNLFQHTQKQKLQYPPVVQ